ncbi:hypothetical protein GCM10023094_32650 [Rhodococcus olei]|uniref:Tyrosine specific protein phosphatases domain-containing protein n=1 Tax=Rhodococcus olei TaxID=2161675 RepID=A0ABP8P5X2_9NOCA
MTTSAPASTFSKRLPLGGTYNFRDLGGIPIGSRTTKWNKLFRSDALHGLDATGRRSLRERGLGVVVDLRETNERADRPNALDGVGHRDVHAPIYDGEIEANLSAFDLEAVYGQMIAERGVNLTRAVRHIAVSGADPVLVHCTAGKDRTGLVIGLTLAAIGADHRDIVADYMVSEVMLSGEWADAMEEILRGYTVPEGVDLARLAVASPAALMRASLDAVVAEHGDARRYLLAHGMTTSELDDLSAALIA